MAPTPPLVELPIRTAEGGFYDGFVRRVTIPSKIVVGALVVWAVALPEQAGAVLNGANRFILQNFATWYVWVMATFVLACLALAVWPTAARMKLGGPDDEPEFNRFSWFSMMFGAGIGVGMLTAYPPSSDSVAAAICAVNPGRVPTPPPNSTMSGAKA